MYFLLIYFVFLIMLHTINRTKILNYTYFLVTKETNYFKKIYFIKSY